MTNPQPFLAPGVNSNEGVLGKSNEDAYTVFKLGAGQWADAPERSIYVAAVADGVTSKTGGARASKIAVETITHFLNSRTELVNLAPERLDTVMQQTLHEAVLLANEEIRKIARQHADLGSMSTTLVLAVVAGQRLYLAHLGDSRAYLMRDGQLHRLTVDHTWVQEALDQGTMSEAEVKAHPNRNVIQRYLGIRDQVDVDQRIVAPGSYARGQARAYVASLTMQPGDVLLLCSDGQVEKVTDAQILATLRSQRNRPQKAADQLIQLALAQQEADNITSLVLALPDAGGGSLRYAGWGLAAIALLLLILFVSNLFGSRGNVGAEDAATPVIVAVADVPTATPSPAADVVTATAQAALPVPSATSTATSTETPPPSPTPSPTTSPMPTETATLSPELTVDATATPTATPSPAPTATSPATDAPPTETSAPTSTPLPTATLTPTRRPPTSTPTPASATAAATAANASSTAAVPSSSNRSAVLLSPPDRETGQGERTFAWQPNFQLADGQAFEVVFWRNGEDPFGVRSPVRENSTTVDLTALYNQQRLAQGEYRWSVLLVTVDPYTRLQMLNDGYRFTFEPQSAPAPAPTTAPPPTSPPEPTPIPTAAGGNER